MARDFSIVLYRRGYDDWGRSEGAWGSIGQGGRFGFTGQVRLDGPRLYQMKARVYAPNHGRFLQPGPIGIAGGINLYAYAGGDPVNRTDPFGLEPITVVGSCRGATCLAGATTAGDSEFPPIEVTGERRGPFLYDGLSDFYLRYFSPTGRPEGPDWLGQRAASRGSSSLPQSGMAEDDSSCGLGLAQDGNIIYEATTGTLIVGGGIMVSRVTFINSATGTTGSFYSLGGGGGADIGVAQSFGTASSLALLNGGGASFNVSAGIATFSANGSLGHHSLTPAGKSAGIGLGPSKWGVSATMTGTKVYGCKVRGQ